LGEFSTNLAIVYFGQKWAKILGYFFPFSYVLILAKKWFGPHFGRFFHTTHLVALPTKQRQLKAMCNE
jgi:hypothetical protein